MNSKYFDPKTENWKNWLDSRFSMKKKTRVCPQLGQVATGKSQTTNASLKRDTSILRRSKYLGAHFCANTANTAHKPQQRKSAAFSIEGGAFAFQLEMQVKENDI